jgi:DNA-binding response OmpR family regulator
MAQKVLVFSQNKALCATLLEGFRKKGFDVTATSSRKRVLDWITLGRSDFLFVDALRALSDEVQFCAELRRLNGDIHILLGVPTRQAADGVDACIAAPVTVRKVHHHIRTLLQADARRLVVAGDVELDARNRIVRCDGREAHLTPKETRLLKLLLDRTGTVVTRAEIMREVWDTEYLGDMRTVDVHIRWLRRKIEPMSSQPAHIHTIRGMGYQFDVTEPAEQCLTAPSASPTEDPVDAAPNPDDTDTP